MSRFTTMRPTRGSSARSLTSLLLAAVVGCADYGPGALRPGQPEADMLAHMGQPTGRYPLAGGASKVEYARGPMGRHTYMVEVDASGRVSRWEQVLTETRFDALAIGTAQADVRAELGRPSEARVGWRGVGEVWYYRFESVFCRWFVVWFVDGRVREASYDTDPMCDDRRQESM